VNKVFVAGHKGTVGSALLRQVPEDYKILTAPRSEVDLGDFPSVYEFLDKERPDSIILAAAKVGGIEANSNHQKDFLLQNLKVQNSVMEAASLLRIQNLLFLGSSCVYPKFADQPISEDSLLKGQLESTNEGYAIAKIAGIKLCRSIYEEQNLNYFSLMPTNLYGPNDNFDPQVSHAPAALLRKFHEAKTLGLEEVIVWGSGKPKREFMHVDDMADACWYMLGQKVDGELINVGTGQDIAIGEFAKLIAKIVGFNGKILFDMSKPDGTPRKVLDTRRIQAYGWKHRIDLKDGLEKTYAWYKSALEKGVVRGQ
jgi:GDP-L-fucose synthase